jgi:hypothetical protein
MMCFSLDYLLQQVVVLGKKNAVDVTPRAERPSKRRVRSVLRSWLDALDDARSHSFRVTNSQSVLGIEHPQEAMGGSLIVDRHKLCDPRAARLNKRNADPEGCNFLRDGCHTVLKS